MKHESATFRANEINETLSNQMAITAARMLFMDIHKRRMFYDVYPSKEKIDKVTSDSHAMLTYPKEAILSALKNTDPRVLHAIIGMMTEVGEIIQNIIINNGKIDSVNMIEEGGDISWYLRLLCETQNITLEKMIEINNAKLDKRYISASTTGTERDISGERALLESKISGS